MAFRFRLRQVLRLKQRVEDARARALAAAVRRRDAVAERLADLRRQTAAGRESLVAAGLRGALGGELGAMAETVDRGSRWSETTASRLADEQSKVDGARADLVRAAQEREALERLEASQRAAWEREARTREQRRLDDVASINHLRRRQGKDSTE